MKLTDKNKAFVKLLLRSPDVGAGWRQVSAMLIPSTEKEVAAHPDLYEVERVGPEGMLIRLSEEGRVVAKYL